MIDRAIGIDYGTIELPSLNGADDECGRCGGSGFVATRHNGDGSRTPIRCDCIGKRAAAIQMKQSTTCSNAPQAPVPTLDGLHETIKRLRLENDPSGQVNSIRVEPTYLPFPELDKNGLETGKEVHAVVVDGVMRVSQRAWDAIEKARME